MVGLSPPNHLGAAVGGETRRNFHHPRSSTWTFLFVCLYVGEHPSVYIVLFSLIHLSVSRGTQRSAGLQASPARRGEGGRTLQYNTSLYGTVHCTVQYTAVGPTSAQSQAMA